MPRAGEGDILRWRRDGCPVAISDTDSIGMLHGARSGTWALDCDDATILEDLLVNYEQSAPRLCVVRTPKQGHHVIFLLDPDDPPPGDIKFQDARGRKIDIKSVGYTLLPPSVHPEQYRGRYEYLFLQEPAVRMRWSNCLHVLNSIGFFSAADREQILGDVMSEGGAGISGGSSDGRDRFTYNELVAGGFGTGERRRKQRSLYIRKRLMGSTAPDAEAAIRHVNTTCRPPLPDREVGYNIRSAEQWYAANRAQIEDRWRLIQARYAEQQQQQQQQQPQHAQQLQPHHSHPKQQQYQPHQQNPQQPQPPLPPPTNGMPTTAASTTAAPPGAAEAAGRMQGELSYPPPPPPPEPRPQSVPPGVGVVDPATAVPAAAAVSGGAGGGAVGSATTAGTSGSRGKKLDMHYCASVLMNETPYIAHKSGDLYYYVDGIWVRGGEIKLRQSAEYRWRPEGITSAQIREIEDIIRIRAAIVPDGKTDDVFDLDPSKIVLENGTYDLEEARLVPHSPAYRATIRHPVTYDPTADCPIFERALRAWFTDSDARSEDAKYVTIITEMFALCMLRRNIIQKGYVLYGKGSNGKSTCLEVLRHMLGDANTASVEMQTFEDSRFVGDVLFMKSANIASDGGTQPLVRTGLIKAILGGDSVMCEPKYRKPFVFKPYATLIFTFNELPPVLDSSDGFARKIQLIPWVNRFDRGQDAEIAGLPPNRSEWSGILNLILPVMRGFLLDHAQPAYEDDVATTQNLWMKRSDSFFMFRSEHIVTGASYQIEVNLLHAIYEQACDEHGMTPFSRNEFHTRVSDLLGGKKSISTRKDGVSTRVWKGLTVRGELRPEGQGSLTEGGTNGGGGGAQLQQQPPPAGTLG